MAIHEIGMMMLWGKVGRISLPGLIKNQEIKGRGGVGGVQEQVGLGRRRSLRRGIRFSL